MFVRIGTHVIRASQIVRVTNSEYHERGGRTNLSRRVIHLRNGHELYEYSLGLDEILEKLNKIGG